MPEEFSGVDEPHDRIPGAEDEPGSEIDRCLRVVREVLLGQPPPHSLEAAADEIERRLRGGRGGP